MNIKQADMILSIWIIGHDALTKESQMFYANGNGFICKMSDGRDLKAMDKDFLQLIDLGYI